VGELIERIRALPLREAAEAIPAIARLLGRLARDPRVDRRRRLLAVAALGYAAAPVDLVPDRIPLVGKLDDVVIIGLAIRTLLDGAPDEVVAEHWDGPSEALEVFDGVVRWVADLVPRRMRWAIGRVTGS
jgi:uncharacterized membrane protein YkvA (DUF1232 family)